MALDDHTEIGGVKGSFNDDPDEAPPPPQMQPVEQHSPTKIRIPSWRVFVLGGSGGLRGRPE